MLQEVRMNEPEREQEKPREGVYLSGIRVHEAFADLGVQALDYWARPESWRGSGEAISIDTTSDALTVVPGGRSVFWSPRPDDLTGAWEVVDPDVVLRERAQIWKDYE